jgi:hypothetical protein
MRFQLALDGSKHFRVFCISLFVGLELQAVVICEEWLASSLSACLTVWTLKTVVGSAVAANPAGYKEFRFYAFTHDYLPTRYSSRWLRVTAT